MRTFDILEHNVIVGRVKGLCPVRARTDFAARWNYRANSLIAREVA